MASFPGQPGKAVPERQNRSGFCWSKRWWGWRWHQLDHMHIICTSLQTDNHASTSLSFYRLVFLPSNQWRQSIEGTDIVSITSNSCFFSANAK